MEPGNIEHPRHLSHRIAATTLCRCSLEDSMHSRPLLIVRPQLQARLPPGPAHSLDPEPRLINVYARRDGRCLTKKHAGGVCMTGAPNSQQNSPSLKAEVSASNKTPNRVRTHSAMEAKVSCRGRHVNGRQRTGRRPTLHSTSHPVPNGVAQALILLPVRFPPIIGWQRQKSGLTMRLN